MSKTAVLTAAGLALGLVVVPGATKAHHAVQAQFDVNQVLEVQGKLVKIDWVNPHVWWHFEVRKADGTAYILSTETPGPNGLRRQGLADRRLFKEGDQYKIVFNPDRTGASMGFTISFTHLDGTPTGRYFQLGFSE